MNKIRLQNEDLSKILYIPQTPDKLAEIWVTLADKGFIFDKFILYVDILQQEYRVKISEERVNNQRKITIVKVQNDDYGLPTKTLKYELNATSYLMELGEYMKSTDNTSFAEMIMKKKWKDKFIDVVIPMSFMQYVIWKSKDREVEIIESKERTGTGKKRTYKRKQKQEYKLLDCIKIYKKRNKNKNGYTYTVESFERRGYYRHYKNGKVTLVRPTTCKPKKKGTEKQNKEYKL